MNFDLGNDDPRYPVFPKFYHSACQGGLIWAEIQSQRVSMKQNINQESLEKDKFKWLSLSVGVVPAGSAQALYTLKHPKILPDIS